MEEWNKEAHECYAIIADPPEPEIEPIELWGVKPKVVKAVFAGTFYINYGEESDDCWNLYTPKYLTRLEAVTAWNRIATALSQVKE